VTLSNRDIASLLWLAVFVVWALSQPGVRSSVVAVWRAFWGKIAVVVAIYYAYLALVIAGAASWGFWNADLTKDTIVWLAVPGLAPLFGLAEAAKKRGFYRRAIFRAISLTALVEFYLNLAAFPLLVELIFIPMAVFLTLLSTVAGFRPEHAIVKRFVDRIVGIVGLVLFVATAIALTSGEIQLDARELILQFGVPVWLTVAASPFIFIFSLSANYEVHFVRIGFHARDDPRARRRAKFALLTTYGARNHELAAFSGIAYNDLVGANTWREARRVVAYRRAEARAEEAAKDLEAVRLVRYEGVPGTDWDGRPHDEREFAETKDGLELLASIHRARQENGRFRKDIMAIAAGIISKTLPDSEFVMNVAKDGRSWFAWRRTVGGWYLGMAGITGQAEDWTYLGEEEPKSFPGNKAGWVKGDFPKTTTVED
jgi:hypothetical protein